MEILWKVKLHKGLQKYIRFQVPAQIYKVSGTRCPKTLTQSETETENKEERKDEEELGGREEEEEEAMD